MALRGPPHTAHLGAQPPLSRVAFVCVICFCKCCPTRFSSSNPVTLCYTLLLGALDFSSFLGEHVQCLHSLTHLLDGEQKNYNEEIMFWLWWNYWMNREVINEWDFFLFYGEKIKMQVFTDCSKDGLIPHWWLSQTCEAHSCDILMKKTSWQMSTHLSHLHYNKEAIFIIHLVRVPHFFFYGCYDWLISLPVICAINHFPATLMGAIQAIGLDFNH